MAAERKAGGVVTVTARLPVDGLYAGLEDQTQQMADAGIVSLTRVGDCNAPGTIQAAVYAGHKVARELDVAPAELAAAGLVRRELPLGVTG